jgi:uncharacterized protein (DUF488 family)
MNRPTIKTKAGLLARKQMRESKPLLIVLTIGHSTRTIGEFIRLLQAHSVTRVVDVRTVPRSRYNPQFNLDSLPVSLKTAGIGYVHISELGGLRHTTLNSVNTGWRNDSFRGYADYMQTLEFHNAIEQLIQLANQDRIAVMCAEAVPWRCHRSLIADALLVRGIRSEDIISATRLQVHTITPFAKVQGTLITYPAEVPQSTQKKPSSKRSSQRATKTTKGATAATPTTTNTSADCPTSETRGEGS